MSDFKEYPRTYEYVFSIPEIIKKKCDIDRVTLFKDIPDSKEKYATLFKEVLYNYEQVVWDSMVKYLWLAGRFKYRGARHKIQGRSGLEVDRGFGYFLKHYVGHNQRVLTDCRGTAAFLRSYIMELFPDLDDRNPFEEKIEMPFPNLTLSHLFLVLSMDERMELLKIANERRMSVLVFMDYVANYVMCYNLEHPETYEFKFGSAALPYVSNCARRRRRYKNFQLRQWRKKEKSRREMSVIK